MALPVKFGSGRWGKKKGSKTINTAGYVIKFESWVWARAVVGFVGIGSFYLRHRKRSAIGFDASKILAEEMENHDSDFFKQVAACLYNPSKHRSKQL